MTAKPTYIDILLDETGSMNLCKSATIAGFNDFIRDQKSIEGECYLTLSKFDTSGIKTPYVNLAIGMVPDLCFYPGGGTNLYDVVGERIEALLEQNRNGRSLVVIMTDGEDTSSRKHSARSVKELVTSAIQQGISFLYFGAGPMAKRIGLDMGLPEQSITVFDTKNMRATMATMSVETRAFRAA